MNGVAVSERLVPLGEVARMLGIARTTLWRLRRTDPTFPVGINVTDHTLRYSSDEIRAWLANRRGVSALPMQLAATASGLATKQPRT